MVEGLASFDKLRTNGDYGMDPFVVSLSNHWRLSPPRDRSAATGRI
jgi:hypothetical protein